MRTVSLVAAGMLVAGLGFTFGSAGPASAGGDTLCFDRVPTIIGSGTIKGTSGPDVILGSEGDDTINGNGGDDLICGGGGEDTIHGNSGHDVLSGGTEDDLIYGDAGNDGYYAGDLNYAGTGNFGDDTFHGGSGNDFGSDYDGTNEIHGDAGSDNLSTSGAAYGGSGNDPYVYAEESEIGSKDGYADGGSGADNVEVYGGTATGGSGSDRYVISEREGDILLGGAGSDKLEAQANNITMNGGTGKDSCLDYDFTGTTLMSCEITVAAP